MFILKLQCIDFNFHISRSGRRQLSLALFDNVIHLVFIQYYHTKDNFFACLSKELSLWRIFRYLVLSIGGLENERSLTIFYR